MSEPAQYGTDEFDVDHEPGVRRGAHRATLSPLVSGLPWIVGALLAVAVIVAVVSLVGGGDLAPAGSDESEPPAATSPTGDAAPTDPGTSPAPTDAGTATGDDPSATTEPPTSAPATSEPPPTPDQSIELTVLNGTQTSGLAAGAAEMLGAEGWTVGTTDNYRDGELLTTVFYATEDLEVTAAAVAEVVGGTTELDPDQTESVTVVLGSDYSP